MIPRPVNIHDRKHNSIRHSHQYRSYIGRGTRATGAPGTSPRIIIIFVISWHSTRRAHQSENRINQLSHSRPNSKREQEGERTLARVFPCLVKYHLIPREIRFNFTRHNTPATLHFGRLHLSTTNRNTLLCLLSSRL